MQQGRETYYPSVSVQASLIVSALTFQICSLPHNYGIVHFRSDMHRTQGVLKSRMCRARINEVRKRQLSDAPQPLKGGVVDYLALPIVILDESVYRVPDLEDGQILKTSVGCALEPLSSWEVIR